MAVHDGTITKKPNKCPFNCGEKAVYIQIRNSKTSSGDKTKKFQVRCRACGARGPWRPTEWQAIVWWNIIEYHEDYLG